MLDDTFAEALVHLRAPLSARVAASVAAASGRRQRSISAHVVLGLRLRPFSLWHACLLDLLQNPFGFYDASEDYAFDFAKAFDFPAHFLGGHIFLNYGALQEAVAICQCRYPQWPGGGGLFARGRRLLAARRYARLVPSSVAVASPRRPQPPSLDNSPYLGELAKLSAYFLDYRTRPIHASLENSKPAKTPWYLITAAGLMRLGISKTEAWNSAAGEAAWLTASACEAAGSPIEILTPQDRLDFAEIIARSDSSQSAI